MSTNHWKQGQWKNWPSEHICFQSSENLISTCGLLRLFFFSFRCWMRVGGLFLILPLQLSVGSAAVTDGADVETPQLGSLRVIMQNGVKGPGSTLHIKLPHPHV